MIMLSRHFSLAELTTTQHRDPLILDAQAKPPDEVLANLQHLCRAVLEPCRETAGRLRVTSGYRCHALNEAVGGSGSTKRPGTKPSAHLVGLAADVLPLDFSIHSAMERIAHSAVPFDKLILEFDAWLHIQAAPLGRLPRRAMLQILPGQGFEPWTPKERP